jgi:crossover junction endodeoxyribonuclease RuvC
VTTSTPAELGPSVIGLDISLTGTGIASTYGWTELVGFKGRTSKETITGLPYLRRLQELHKLAERIIHLVGRPDLAVIERPALSRSGGGAHERAWLWWEVYGKLTALGIPVGFLAIQQIKLYATGKSTGTKGPVIDAVARRWPDWATGGDDNRADAVVLMAAGRDRLGEPLTTVPKTHRAAIEKADWPTPNAAS